MSVPRGFATRDGVYGAGIEYPRPQAVPKAARLYYDVQVQKLLPTLVEEVERQTITRTGRHEPVDATADDIDAAFGVVLLTKMVDVQVPQVSRLQHVFRRVVKVRYRLPEAWSPRTIRNFEDQLVSLIGKWAMETDRLIYFSPFLDRNQAIDRALNAVVNALHVRLLEQAAQTTAPAVRHEEKLVGSKRASWLHVLLTGLRLRRFWARLRTSVLRLFGVVLAMVGGAGSLWTIVERELTASSIDGLGAWWIALVVVGIIVMLGGGGRADSGE